MMSTFKEMDVKGPHPPEIRDTGEPKTIVDILNYCQVIYKTVQRLEKKFDDIDEKVTKIYHARARSFWRYPPLKAASRRYNYLMSKRYKLQRLRQFVHESSVSYPQSYSPTSPVRARGEDRQNMENTVEYTQTLQYSNSIDNTQTFQCADSVDNIQTFQCADSVDNIQTFQCADSVDNTQTSQYDDSVDNTQTSQYDDSVDNTQTSQYADSVDNTQTSQYDDSVDNTQTFQHANADSIDNIESIQNPVDSAVFHSDDSQDVIFISSSPEVTYQESPPSPTYTTETYEQHYRFRNIPGSSTMPYYSDLENTNLDTVTSATSAVREARTLPPGELIPIRNPEMRRSALLEAQRTPVIDPNTFGSSSECNNAVVRHLGIPLNWSVNDVITFLNRLDPPLADQLYPTIRQHNIDGKALLQLDTDVMMKYMKINVGVAMKFGSYIQKLKQGVNCGQ